MNDIEHGAVRTSFTFGVAEETPTIGYANTARNPRTFMFLLGITGMGAETETAGGNNDKR